MIKKAKRILSVTLSIMLIVSLFAGCGGQKQENNTENSASVTEKKIKMETIRVWNKEGHSKDQFVSMVQEYNNTIGKEKGINIEYTNQTASNYTDVLRLALSSGEAPELFQVGEPLDAYISANWILPIEDMPKGEEFLKNYDGLLFPAINIFNGKTYRVPANVNSSKFVYNKDLFKKAGIVDDKGEAKPPKTWADVREYAKTITEKSGGKEFGYVFALKWPNFFNYDVRKAFSAAIGHDGYDFKTGQYRFVDFKPAYELLLEMKKDGSIFPGAENLDADAARAQVSEGKIAMKPAFSFDVAVYNDQFPMKGDLAFTYLPVFDEGNRFKEYAWTGDITCIGTAANKLPEKSFEVFKWINSDQFIADMYAEAKYLPYKSDITKLAKTQPTKKGWTEFADLSKSYLTPQTPDGILKIEGDNFNTVSSKILTGTVKDIEKTLIELDKRYNAALAKAAEKGTDITPYKDSEWDISLK